MPPYKYTVETYPQNTPPPQKFSEKIPLKIPKPPANLSPMLGELSPTAFARTPEVLEALEEALIASHGDLPTAARRIRVPLRQVHMWTAADPEVYNRVREAQIIGWQALESVAYKRAVKGIKEDVYYQGLVVGQRKVYSDGLLSQLLKARVPAFNTDAAAAQRNPVSVNVNVMPRASSYEEWVAQRQHTLAQSASVGAVVEGEVIVGSVKADVTTLHPDHNRGLSQDVAAPERYNPDDWAL